MRSKLSVAAAAASVMVIAISAGGPALAQKPGGILRLSHFDSPASMSILEESTRAALQPMMGVFNNLVMYDQHIAKSSLETVVPDLATSWSWSEDGTELTFPLRQGVKWHDGKPFTSADVKCTWDLLMGTGSDKLRVNPRKSWYDNVTEVSTRGDLEVTFKLKQPQPYLLTLVASGWSPIYPCHVPAREMRQHPIGTGPFKFVDFKPNEYIKVTKNPAYWKPGRPYLDGIEYTIMREAGPRNLAFFAGKFDMIPLNVSIPTLRDFKEQAPQALCQVGTGNVPRTLLINPSAPPFDNSELRRAMGLAFDRQAFLDILNEGKGAIGGNMLPPPDGAWGMPREVLQTLPGYGPDVEKNRAEARKTMEKLGYGPDKRLAINNRLQAVLRHVLVEHDQVVEHLHYRQFGVGKLLKHREARDTLGVIHPQRAAGLLGECRGGNCERGQESGDRPEGTNVRLHVTPPPRLPRPFPGSDKKISMR